jgi:proline iminopeptidase
MSNSIERYISTPHGRLWTECHGPDQSGTPVLVLHGGPGFLSLTPVIRDLSADRPVYFYDQSGCGRSDSPADPSLYSVEHYVAELGQVCEALGLSDVHLLAQSWGAMLAVEYLLRLRPARVRSLILSGPLLSVPLWERDQRRHVRGLPRRLQNRIAAAEASGCFDGDDYSSAMMAFYRRHVCRLDPWPAFLVDALGRMNLEAYLSMWGPSEFTTTGTLKGADLLPRLPEIRSPVLLVGGEHDEAAPDTLLTYRHALPRGEMAVLPNASHLHHLEQPVLFLALVRDFLNRVEAACQTSRA